MAGDWHHQVSTGEDQTKRRDNMKRETAEPVAGGGDQDRGAVKSEGPHWKEGGSPATGKEEEDELKTWQHHQGFLGQ